MSAKGYRYTKQRAVDFMNMRKRVSTLNFLTLHNLDRSLLSMVTQAGMNVIESRLESLVVDHTTRFS